MTLSRMGRLLNGDGNREVLRKEPEIGKVAHGAASQLRLKLQRDAGTGTCGDVAHGAASQLRLKLLMSALLYGALVGRAWGGFSTEIETLNAGRGE